MNNQNLIRIMGPVMNTNNVSKLIVYNIIELLPEFREMNITVNYNYRCEYSARYNIDDGTVNINITPNMNHMSDTLDNFNRIKKLYMFLESVNVDINIGTFIFAVLHELGHGILYKNFRFGCDVDSLTNINKFFEKTYKDLRIDTLEIKYKNDDYITRDGIVEYAEREAYSNSPVEMMADLFAYTRFMYVYNSLKERGLI